MAEKKARSSRRRRAKSGEAMTVHLPHALAQRLRMRALKERRSISNAVEVAVTAWLATPLDIPPIE